MPKPARFIVTDDFVDQVNKVRKAYPKALTAASLVDVNRKTGALLFPSAEGPWAMFPGGSIDIIEDEAAEQLTASITRGGKAITIAEFEKLVAA